MKPYRIEQTLRLPAPAMEPEAEQGPHPVPVAQEMADVLSALKELRQILDPTQAPPSLGMDACRRDIGEVYGLRGELEAMKRAIVNTKREIASIYWWQGKAKGIHRASGELDAVLEATEQATTAILSAAEDIEANASMLRAAGADTGSNDCVGAILDRVVTLYETCNFQDLTGQRMTKIVGVLTFVEERLDALIGVWGGLAAFKEFSEQDSVRSTEAPRVLLSGPRLEDESGHVSQSEIDALFD